MLCLDQHKQIRHCIKVAPLKNKKSDRLEFKINVHDDSVSNVLLIIQISCQTNFFREISSINQIFERLAMMVVFLCT